MSDAVLYLSLATAISSSYVALLYAFDFDGVDRNDPRSVKRRFLGAAVNNIISITCTYTVLSKNHDSPFLLMGMHSRGIHLACLLPTVLTCICYLGTWVLAYVDGNLSYWLSMSDWKQRANNIIWIRDALMAPITEELAFRACASALVLQCLSSTATVFVAPLPFALSHLHHIFDDMRRGYTQCEAISRRGNLIFFLHFTACT
ncbi:unnamed protein product [Gongylonema pulchrum]|uniref:CAAX prenyl protease 2 n=1 Tax=Gongylonema pulchrum TaxID=637853 RepID=A0A183DP17_9BILA|nr:unnamed protein product [Gongylonema pulchrum]